MSQDNSGNGATRQTVKDWEEAHGEAGKDPKVPLLIDTNQTMVDYMISAGGGWPTVALMNESMTQVWTSIDNPTPFDYLMQIHERTIGKE
jgi:hypothetical protein